MALLLHKTVLVNFPMATTVDGTQVGTLRAKLFDWINLVMVNGV